jgi:2-polyprenyl-3-methyl-5-hydroxy-6-metoxy-1,4-benzoquinol methylase
MSEITSEPLTRPDDWACLYDSTANLPSLQIDSEYENILWFDLIEKAVADVRSGGKVIELGSAPGKCALTLARLTQCVPYGVEYTKTGAALNRRLFEAHRVATSNVFEASFLDNTFLASQEESYDVVSSFGVLEHFENPRLVIENHVRLLRPGGTLVVSIPNFIGWNGLFRDSFDPTIKPTHNLALMDLKTFGETFEKQGLDIVTLTMGGRYHFFFTTPQTGIKRFIQLVMVNIEPAVHRCLKLLSKLFKCESSFFSPYLLCVAKKR